MSPLHEGINLPIIFDHALRAHFSLFVRKCFQELNGGEKLQWNWHLESMVYRLDQIRAGKVLRLDINIPPRSLKSTLVSVAFVAWCLGHRPDLKFICVSYAQDLSDEHGRLCLKVIQSEWYRRIFRCTRLDPRRSSASFFVTTAGGYRLATSIDGTLTGKGADIIIIDDPMKAEDGQSEAARTKVKRWYDSTLSTRLNDKNRGAIILIMQRLHLDDLTAHVLEKEEWVHLRLPAIAQTDLVVPLGPSKEYAFRAGETLHPARESLERLKQIHRTMGNAQFSAQYLQEPVPLEGNMVRREWFRTYECEPVFHAGDEIAISWDTAMKSGELNDHSVATVWLIHRLEVGCHYYLLDVVREKLEYPDLLKRAIKLRERWSGASILIEDKASGQSLIQDLRRLGLGPIAIPANGDKITRFSAQTAVIEQGRVFLPARAPWREPYIQELMQFPGGRSDDQVDSTAHFLGWAEHRPARREFW